MKKMYVTPQVEVVKINQSMNLLSGSGPVNSTGGNGGFSSTISGSLGARKFDGDWDDEW